MNPSEKQKIKHIHFLAFGKEGEEIANLAEAFLAEPETISISASRDGELVGNVLFTPFVFEQQPEKKCYLLAPIGVLPEYQRGFGVGKELMEKSIAHLKSMGTQAIFVLGVPDYYPKYGFVLAEQPTPYPELLTMPQAWMVLELQKGAVEQLSGPTLAIKPFMNPLLWDTSGRG